MNTKAQGVRAERRARLMLEAQECTVVRAGAGQGPFDLVAFGRTDLRLIQVKVDRIPARNELARLHLIHNLLVGTTEEIWRFFDREPPAEIVVLGFSHAEKVPKHSGFD